MCTAITLQTQTDEVFFGRTMDFSHDIIPQLYVVPECFVWTNSINNCQMRNTYKFIGLGQELDGVFGLFDGVNEKGFAAAALYFAGYARYNRSKAQAKTEAISSVDFLHYILANCASVSELPALLENITIMGIADPVTNTIAPLHWIATDRSGACVVIESSNKGLEILDNPVGVMANSPDFQWHLTNLRNYMNASPAQSEYALWGDYKLTPFGQAGGTTALPGGFTSPERFVRVAYLKSNIPKPKSDREAVTACFHILENVSIPKGAVITSQNTYDYTKYTAIINTSTCEYIFKTYDDLNIARAGLFDSV